MGDALRKQDSQEDGHTASPPIGDVTGQDNLSVAAVMSPAKALQDKLHLHFADRTTKFSAQFITWLVMGACLGTWLGGVGLYATL